MCQNCNWGELILTIDDILNNEDYEWARDTLEGIRSTVEDNAHATDRQKEAVENISNAGNR